MKFSADPVPMSIYELERFAKSFTIDPKTECWNWDKFKLRGYGYFKPTIPRRSNRQAHRYAYEVVKGKMPEGLVTDHLCRNPSCVNPKHLEAVSNKVNTMRGVGPTSVNAKKTHCKRGHSLLEGKHVFINKRGHRYCRACDYFNKGYSLKGLGLE